MRVFGTLFVNGHNLGNAMRLPNGTIEQGPHVDRLVKERNRIVKDVLKMLLNLSDQQFDPIAKDKLKALLEGDKPTEEMKTGLKDLLDICVNGSLCSDFEIRVMDLAWRHYGGSP